MQGTRARSDGGFITPSRRSPSGKFMFDQPLSTKREKLLRGTPARYKIPPAPSMKSAPNAQRYGLIRAHIEPFARIVSFKKLSDQPCLSSKYQPSLDESYLQQCFVLQGRVGQGDFGEVFSVRSKDDGRFYAIKCSLEIYRNLADRREKLQEVHKHELLPPHPNLLHFVKAWEQSGRLYIQTELCCGSLDDVGRQRHEIGEPQIWYYLIDILLALEHMHSHDLIHVDIKPSNIFLTSDGICKLGDFGLVFDLNKDDPRNLTEGDSKYLAAEVLNDKPTKAADIFSLGITILELATDLDLPSNGVFWHEIRNRVIDEKYIAPLSTDLRRILACMLDPNPLNRPKASELLNDPAVQKHIHRRQLQLIKHRVVSLVNDRLVVALHVFSTMFFHLLFPLIWLYHFFYKRLSEPKNSTPYAEGRAVSKLLLTRNRDRTPEFNLTPPPNPFTSPICDTPPFRHRLNFDEQTSSDNESGHSPVERAATPLPTKSIGISPFARYMGSGDSPTSTRPSRKRGPRHGDELFGAERRLPRWSRDENENEGELSSD